MHCIAEKWRSFCKTVADCIRELSLEEEAFYFRIKFGSTDSVECDMASECCLKFHTDDAAHKSVHVLIHPGESAALLDCRKN